MRNSRLESHILVDGYPWDHLDELFLGVGFDEVRSGDEKHVEPLLNILAMEEVSQEVRYMLLWRGPGQTPKGSIKLRPSPGVAQVCQIHRCSSMTFSLRDSN